ncbi:MAG TPA: sugar phosphate isomerase/epimerase family protein [Bryobacteraceae bacterium]|nr:sugar phosphate isomerase/epimerase family protein [Bryobacteraceae bacterium]
MKPSPNLTRRSFLAASAIAPIAWSAAESKIPVGLELFSVRNEMAKDLPATVTAVAKMGYQVVEFFAPYYDWTEDYTKQVRKLLDDLGVRCNSTHNGPQSFAPEGVAKAIDRNHILGAKFIVNASAGNPKTLDGWKHVAETLTAASEKFRAAGLRGGYHNHQTEFQMLEGKRPIEVIAANTPRDFMLQLDVGTCVEVGSDPVAWIKSNPGRINSLHLKDWAPGSRAYTVLFGEGVCPWPQIFAAAESAGGVEYYLIEQEGSRFPELETAQRCLEAYKKLRSL